jgi:hypothetical protein
MYFIYAILELNFENDTKFTWFYELGYLNNIGWSLSTDLWGEGADFIFLVCVFQT